jgi:hypothetical protein
MKDNMINNKSMQFVINVWCKDCAKIEKFIFKPDVELDLCAGEVIQLLHSYLKDGYKYSVIEMRARAISQHLYDTLTMPGCYTTDALIRRCRSLRLKRYVRTTKTVFTTELVDKLVNPIPFGFGGLMVHNTPWADRDTFNDYDYTFFKGMFIPGLMELLRSHGIYSGITKYGDVYACGKFEINWERHPLFKNGVFRIERIKETTCTKTEIIQDK